MSSLPVPARTWILATALSLVACAKKADEGAAASAGPPPAGATTVAVTVDAEGYRPSPVTAPAGKPVRLVFTRTSDQGCGQQLVFPELNLRRDLPLNREVAVDLTMPASGSLSFTCGMNMYKGALVAQQK